MGPSADDWRRRAACRNTAIEMVPDDRDGDGLRLAKKMCAGCPVRIRCLLAAEDGGALTADGYVYGVWGGLTHQERATMAGIGRLPAPCTSCGLECVPINLSTTECAACKPAARIVYDDYRLMIEQMVRDGKSYLEIAERLRLKKTSVVTVCRRWKLKIGSRSANRQLAARKECGTLAAKYWHHRKERYSWRDCPKCRLVPWNAGGKRPGKAVA